MTVGRVGPSHHQHGQLMGSLQPQLYMGGCLCLTGKTGSEEIKAVQQVSVKYVSITGGRSATQNSQPEVGSASCLCCTRDCPGLAEQTLKCTLDVSVPITFPG